MSLEKQTVVDLIEIVENGNVQVRTKTVILEDDRVLTTSFHRYTIMPGDDYTQEFQRVQAVCQAVHTSEVVAAFQQAVKEELARLTPIDPS